MMGEAQLSRSDKILFIYADLVLYGNAANETLAQSVAADVQNHWNEPVAAIFTDNDWYRVMFIINGIYDANLTPVDVYENTDPGKNYFRVEEFAGGNISFVDGVNSNTGYFKLDNLLNNSTTAAHEFGHTIGLEHPHITDIRGKGVPGIMYPRGTIVDPQFQYDPNALPLQPGGTMNPFARKVLIKDIADLQLHTLNFNDKGFAVIGDFSSIWHEAHQL